MIISINKKVTSVVVAKLLIIIIMIIIITIIIRVTKFMIEIMFYSLKLFNSSFLKLLINKVVVFKTVKSLLSLFQIDGPRKGNALLY